MFIKKNNASVYIVGNGGSAGIASHFCIDLLNALGIATFTLVDSNVITCFSNDYGYENSFSKALEVLIRKNDLLVAISSSGQSPNILRSAAVAKKNCASVVTLSGFKENNPLSEMGDLNFWLDAKDYGLVETGHFFLLHTIIDLMKSNDLSAAKNILRELSSV